MHKVTINLYYYQDLTPQAQQKALIDLILELTGGDEERIKELDITPLKLSLIDEDVLFFKDGTHCDINDIENTLELYGESYHL